jgi:hypothetical protein
VRTLEMGRQVVEFVGHGRDGVYRAAGAGHLRANWGKSREHAPDLSDTTTRAASVPRR